MKTFFGILGVVMLGVSYFSFGYVRNRLEVEQTLNVIMAELYGHPELAVEKKITRADLVDFEKLEQRQDDAAAFSYLGVATGIGGVACIGAAVAIGFARRSKKPKNTPVGAAA